MAQPGASEAGDPRGEDRRGGDDGRGKQPFKCCVASFDTPTFIGERRVIRRPGQRRAELRFRMLATFRSDPLPSPEPIACQCSCCEYRQEVRGFFKLDGEELVHPLANGEVMDKLEWREDGMTRRLNGVERHIHYGHRGDPPSGLIDSYLPDRLYGCRYEGRDAPFLAGPPGTPFEIDLDFRGRIIDGRTGETVQTRTWGFKMKGLLSRRRELWE